ncbi:MAG TPA: M3 family oligoendopeptidase [Opitutaceae bacterium]|jgi:oligoendopeptidase F|nr:M3 family oligoendopeptidase [Opitutaceae bacterium]
MNLLPFGNLPSYRPRKFVPQSADLGDPSQITPLFDQLEKRGADCTTAAELERWLLDWSELSSAIDEEGCRRHIAMTCHTDNADAEKSHLDFVEKIEPQIKPRQFALEKTYAAHPLRAKLPATRFHVFDRDVKNRVELFRPENVPLETEDAKLSQQYQKLTGSLTVKFRDEEKTLTQMGRYFEEPDRELRREAWELVTKRRLMETEKFDELFDQMLKLRTQMARNAGFENYRDYAFRRLGRFDYTPKDCEAFHGAVEEHLMPIMHELQAERRRQLRLDALRPWDLAVDPKNRPPLKPFAQVDEMVSRTQKIFDRLDGELSRAFRQMQELRLLDLDNRKGKAPGGYQATLNEARLPFIFMNAVGVQRDVETILHEAGHAFHALAAREDDLYTYHSSAPMEFCEVASMSMELLGNEFLEEFYSAADANRARRVHLEGLVDVFRWVATVDAFQHWIYTHPAHTRAERAAAWIALMDRFGAEVDWRGFENAKANFWHRQLHIFLYPFYYIEYGIAQLGALQVWANSKRDQVQALNAYKNALALGGSRPLPELFSAAGCSFEFSAKTIQPLAKILREELAKL